MEVFKKQWLYEHRNNPFPTPDEKDEIIAATGLSGRQVKDWMAGARRRQKKNPVDVVANPALEKKQKREDIIEKVSTSTSTTKAADKRSCDNLETAAASVLKQQQHQLQQLLQQQGARGQRRSEEKELSFFSCL